MVASAETLLRTVDGRLSRLLELEEDWDSYGGKTPTVTSVLVAGRFVQSIFDRFGEVPDSEVLPTAISPLAYGGVQLEWERGDAVVAVDVGPEGTLGVMMRRVTGAASTYLEFEHLEWGEAQDQIRAALDLSS